MTISPILTFTPTNWNLPQTITVSALNDTTPEGAHNGTISHAIASTDPSYSGLSLPILSVAIADDDAEIRGMKWHDLDGDSVKEAGEPGLANWTIYLDANANGQLDTGETSVQTDADGSYRFTDLRPGTYTVAEVLQDGWKQTFPAINVTTTASSTQLYTPSVPELLTSSSTVTSAGQLINLDDFRNDTRFAGIDGKGFASVIIDTGIDVNHTFFGPDADSNGIADRIVYQYDFADNDADASDKNGHGSHVASIIGSSDSTYGGIAPEADLIALKVFKDSGSGYFSDLEESLQWVINNATTYNIASVNLSLGDERNWATDAPRYGIGDELAALTAKGIIVTAAAGNNFARFGSLPGLAYPAADPNTIAVGAVGSTTDQIADFSQRDQDLLDSFAPGISIVGANATGGTQTLSGTSQAAPHLAGIAVLAQQIAEEKLGRKLTVSEFQTLLTTTGTPINDGDDEVDAVTNTGLNFPRVNILALAEGILALDKTPANPNPIGVVDNSTDEPLYLPNDASGQAHTVTVTAGQVATGVDFGNQLIFIPSTLAFSAAQFSSNEDGTTTNTVTIIRTGSLTGAVGVRLKLSNGSAIRPDDYDNAFIDIVFADGEGSKTIPIPIQDDAWGEINETIKLSLTQPTGGAILGEQSAATITIVDNDTSLVFASDLFGIRENGTILSAVTVQRLGLSTGAVGATIYLTDGTAQAPDDYIGEPISVQFADGETSKTITVPINNDAIAEGQETLVLELRDPVGNTNIGIRNQSTLFILDDDAATVGTIKIGDGANNSLKGTDSQDTLYGGSGNDKLFGKNGDDNLFGGEGNDQLDGGLGNDLMVGGSGNDTYFVDSLADQIVEEENAGTDTVRSTLTWELGDHLENLTLLGSEAINGTGNSLNNVIVGNGAANILSGNDGNDRLDGGLGDDLMAGGLGNDTYYVDSLADQTVEDENAGIDTVRSTLSWSLDNHLENLVLLGANAINGTGNALNNTLTGSEVDNILSGDLGTDKLRGNDGNDLLFGGEGNDRLDGGLGDDILVGGLGNDRLIGGDGADRFVYTSLNDATDIITDFTTGTDKIVLTDLLTSLGYSGSNPIGEGYVTFRSSSKGTYVQVDPDGLSGLQQSRSLVLAQNVDLGNLSNVNNFEF